MSSIKSDKIFDQNKSLHKILSKIHVLKFLDDAGVRLALLRAAGGDE